jgi:PAS domain S-box-containing protein
LIDAFYERSVQLDAVTARLAALLEAGMDLAGRREPQSLVETFCLASRKIIGAQYAVAGILDAEKCALLHFQTAGMDESLQSKLQPAGFARNHLAEVACSRQPRRADGRAVEPREFGLPAECAPIHSFLGVPVQSPGVVYGWLCLLNKVGASEFTGEDEKIASTLAAQAAIAYENVLGSWTTQERARELEAEIEERKRAEHHFRMLVEAAPTGIVISNENGRITEVNAEALRMFGYSREELVGQAVETLLPQHLREAHEGHRYAKDLRARPMGVGIGVVCPTEGRDRVSLEISLGPLVTKEGTVVSSTIVDITVRKKMEERLRLSQRMEAIGTLAGGIAHDFNNLLGVIQGCSEAIAEELLPNHPASRKVELVRKAAASAADLTRQLLAIGRKQILQPKVIESKEIVSGMESMLRRLIGENIELAVTIEPTVGCISADPGQVAQVLVNLAANARDAMANGGRLSIEVCNAELDEAYKRQHAPIVPGPYVMIAVADTGCGMDRKTQSQIFDPFFSTKESGKGTGLGLATVYGIVKQSAGYIWVYSEVAQGTVFKVYLPRVEHALGPSGQTEREGAAPQGSETILLAEDSEALLEIAQEYLRRLGYTVIEAVSGEQALQRANEFEGTIHLLVADVVMPGMSGRELADQIVSKRPGIKVLFTSGYADDAIARHGLLEPSVAFIQKPYHPKVLARKVREVLGQPVAKGDRSVPPRSIAFPTTA